MIRLEFESVRITTASDTPVLLLREADGVRVLPIWLSPASAASILSAIEPGAVLHSTAHDLVIEIVRVAGVVVTGLHIEGVDDGVYAAHLAVAGQQLACRVSDGVAVALRCGAPITADRELFDQHATGGSPTSDPEGAVEQFREFLASVNPDDFVDDPRQGQDEVQG